MKYIFLHIGKTGGTSFREFLQSNVERWYNGYNKLHYLVNDYNLKKFLDAEPEGLQIFRKYDLFSEHFGYGFHKHLKGSYQYFTLLRHPVERFISNYLYIKYDMEWIPRDQNIWDWIESPVHINLDHHMIDHVCGEYDKPWLTVEEKKKIALSRLRSDNLLFGFTEKYREFVDLCCKIHDFEPLYERLNVTESTVRIGPIDRAALTEFFKHDIEFYNEARKIYDDKTYRIKQRSGLPTISTAGKH